MNFALEAERGVLAALLAGAGSEPIKQLVPADFSDTFHARVFACLQSMIEAGFPLNLLAIRERMRLDDVDAARLGALDFMLAPRPDIDLVAYAHKVKTESRLRRVRLQCESVLAANGDASSLVAQLAMASHQFLTEAKTEEKPEELFDTWAEFETTPPVSFAVNGFLQNEAITAIAGLSGHGKTWIALSLIRALLFGPGKLWDLFQVPERCDKVIYLIPESSRTAIKHRLQLTGLYDEIRTGRLRMRTLSKGPTISLADTALLRAAKGAHIIADTAIRFMHDIDESNASEVAQGLSNDFLGMLRAEASSVIPLFHSPKNFLKDTMMTLEGMIRGSSEFGAVLATAWGIKQVDEPANIVHIQNLKARDFEHCGPFQIIGRPYINDTEDFALHKRPEDCGSLADEQPELHRGGAPKDQRDAKAANLALMLEWDSVEPKPTSEQLSAKFKARGIEVSPSTIRTYRRNLRKES